MQPEGFVQKGQEHLVCSLKKPIYGLKHDPRSWYTKIDSFFKQQGFLKSKNSDSSQYIKKDEEGNVCLISLYVDDLIITGGSYQLISNIKSNMSQEFEMKDLRDLHYCLSIYFWRESSKNFITQRNYAR